MDKPSASARGSHSASYGAMDEPSASAREAILRELLRDGQRTKAELLADALEDRSLVREDRLLIGEDPIKLLLIVDNPIQLRLVGFDAALIREDAPLLARIF
jgi:hypothetical protein